MCIDNHDAGNVHEHSGNGDFVSGAGLDAGPGVHGLPAVAETNRLEQHCRYEPHDQPKPTERSDQDRDEIVSDQPISSDVVSAHFAMPFELIV
jgi:hypothetical protein